MKKIGSIVMTALLAGLPAVAAAQDAAPHHQRVGLMLDLADQEAKLIYAVFTAKVFDLELSKTLVADLRRAIGDSKGSAFRATALLDPAEAKLEGDYKKLQESIHKIETAGEKLEGDLKAETKGIKSGEESGPIRSADEDDDEGKQPNWELLKDDLGQLYKELSDARAMQSKLGKQVKLAPLKPPPPPKAKKG